MTATHPIHALRASLEDKRLEAVQALADLGATAGTPLDPTILAELALIQLALTAVREEIDAHSVKLGWGSAEALA